MVINELQKKLLLATGGAGGGKMNNTSNSIDVSPMMCCTKCSEEIEIKIRQIENLKIDNEQLTKSKDFLRSKLDDSEYKESDLITQVKKYADLVKHIEHEKDQAILEKQQCAQEKLNSDNKIEEFLKEFQTNLSNEKKLIVENVETQIEQANEKCGQLEERCFKQEALIDRLTRDKIGLISEMESYKSKCNSIDLDTHQMADKLRGKLQEALKERDVSLYELKRVRHDYDANVRDGDQEMFCLRNELSKVRSRLVECDAEVLSVNEQCITLTEEVNKLKTELVSLKHSKNTLENSRDTNLQETKSKFESREIQLASGIEALQVRYCLTVKELEDLIELQKKHITKLKSECRTLNEQLEILAVKYRNDVSYLTDNGEQYKERLEKYKERSGELEEQSVRHNELHDKMKVRLKEMTFRIEEQNQQIDTVKSNENLMRSTNLQLIHDIEASKKQLNLYAMPTKFSNPNNDVSSKYSLFAQSKNLNIPLDLKLPPMLSSRSNNNNGVLETARTAIEESIYSIRSKIAV